MASLILIIGIVSLVLGIFLQRRRVSDSRAFWILSRALIGLGILTLGYMLIGQLGYAILYNLGR